MFSRIALPCALLLGLAGCTSQTMADGSTRLSISPANLFAQPALGQPGGMQPAATGNGLTYDSMLVHRVAVRFVADWRGGGMAGLVGDIQRCYVDAERGGTNRFALKDCMALDTAGKNRDFANQQRFHVPGLDYFSNDAELVRFRRYAPQAFGSSAEALDFVGRDGRAVYFQAATMLGES